jgi:hypothetical protein
MQQYLLHNTTKFFENLTMYNKESILQQLEEKAIEQFCSIRNELQKNKGITDKELDSLTKYSRAKEWYKTGEYKNFVSSCKSRYEKTLKVIEIMKAKDNPDEIKLYDLFIHREDLKFVLNQLLRVIPQEIKKPQASPELTIPQKKRWR